MKEIQLTQGRVALVDDEDYEFLNQFKWHADNHGHTFYAARSLWINGKKVIHLMHWYVMKGKGVDHIKDGGLNNQKSNLRFCDKSKNAMNQKPRKVGTSKYKGVC